MIPPGLNPASPIPYALRLPAVGGLPAVAAPSVSPAGSTLGDLLGCLELPPILRVRCEMLVASDDAGVSLAEGADDR